MTPPSLTPTDVPAGTELTFDYQWPPSSRPPTRCFCSTPTCRGYLETSLLPQQTLKNKENKENSDNNKSDKYDKYDKNGKIEIYRRKGQWKGRQEFFSFFTKKNILSDQNILIKDEIKLEIKGEIKTESTISADSVDQMEIDSNESTATTQTKEHSSLILKEHSSAVLKECSSEPLDPLLLVGKFVKVWWENNLRYYEADVGEYSTKTGIK